MYFSYIFNGDIMFKNFLKLKNFLLICLCLIFCLNIHNNTYASNKKLNINARSYIVLDRKSKKVLIGKNEYSKVKMASTTKIMSAIVILEHCNLNDIVNISKKAANTGGSRLGLKINDKITVHDLLYGLLLCSGNDAAVALAEYLSGSIHEFCNCMNEKAKELGLNNTHFETPHGLDSDGHYTTAYELALITDYALQNEQFRKIVNTKVYTVTINGYPKAITNTNELLGIVDGLYGVKTGFTNGANRCLVTACQRNGMDVICVVLGCDTKKFRGQDSIKLINYCFDNFQYVNIEEIIEKSLLEWKKSDKNTFDIIKGKSNNLNITYAPINYPIIPINKNDISFLNIKFNISQSVPAPIVADTILGSYEVCAGDIVISGGNLVSINEIQKKDIIFYFTNFFKNYCYILNDFI